MVSKYENKTGKCSVTSRPAQCTASHTAEQGNDMALPRTFTSMSAEVQICKYGFPAV